MICLLYTSPRIAGVVDMRCGGYKLSILKSCDGNPASVQILLPSVSSC